MKSTLRSFERASQHLPLRAAVSQHLQVLRAAGLVVVRADGTRRLYRVDNRGIEAVRRWFDGFWDETLDAFRQAAESAAMKKGRK